MNQKSIQSFFAKATRYEVLDDKDKTKYKINKLIISNLLAYLSYILISSIFNYILIIITSIFIIYTNIVVIIVNITYI